MTSLSRLLTTLALAATIPCVACHGVLDVSDPTLVQDKDIANAAGADARRLDAALAFPKVLISTVNDVALISDERTTDFPATYALRAEYYLDRRDSEGYESLYSSTQSSDPHLGNLDGILTKSSIAIPAIRAYTPDSLRGDFLGQLYAIRGYIILQMAEDICSGFPINDVVNDLPVLSAPYSTDSAVAYAITQLDTAIAEVHDSVQYRYFADVLKGRALLDLGQYAQAAAAVQEVPSDFQMQGSPFNGYNTLYQQSSVWPNNRSNIRFAVGDTEGTNGMPFVKAHDPRVLTVYKTTRYVVAKDSLYDQQTYTGFAASLTLASSTEAQLIQAEAALNAGDPSWITTLNNLRATASLGPLTAPTAAADQVDMLYRERAFWLYLTGRRLGDLRRLIRNYGRSPETVFPTGPYPLRGGNYGPATSIPFVFAVESRVNPKITSACAVR